MLGRNTAAHTPMSSLLRGLIQLTKALARVLTSQMAVLGVLPQAPRAQVSRHKWPLSVALTRCPVLTLQALFRLLPPPSPKPFLTPSSTESPLPLSPPYLEWPNACLPICWTELQEEQDRVFCPPLWPQHSSHRPGTQQVHNYCVLGK